VILRRCHQQLVKLANNVHRGGEMKAGLTVLLFTATAPWEQDSAFLTSCTNATLQGMAPGGNTCATD